MSDVRNITIPCASGERVAVLAVPGAGPAKHPGVVVIHDITGFRPDTRRHCERFADAGYVAIAPDLYGGGSVGCVVRTLLSSGRGKGEAHELIATARRTLAQRDDVDEDRIGVMGFCMGGGFALIAAADDQYAVAAPFYGDVPKRAERLRGICPTLAQYGEHDRAFTSHAKRLRRHLKELDVPHEVLIHPGVGHSFMNDHKGAAFRLGAHLPPMYAKYDESTEADAWARVLAFFSEHMPAAA